MAGIRAMWKGQLKMSLVTCPVCLYNAKTYAEYVTFNLLHKDTHNRVQMKPHDPDLGLVERSDLVKGYEFDKGHYAVFTDEDFERIQIESTKTIVIEKFVDATEVDTIYYNEPYYLAPDGLIADEAFRVIQWAMRDSNKVALSRVVLSSRERLVALSPRGKGLLMMTLRPFDEVRDARLAFENIGDEPPDQQTLKLAAELVKQKSDTFDPAEFKDRYREAVVDMVKLKLKGQTPVPKKAPRRKQVVNLLDALRQSIKDDKPAKRKASKKRTAA